MEAKNKIKLGGFLGRFGTVALGAYAIFACASNYVAMASEVSDDSIVVLKKTEPAHRPHTGAKVRIEPGPNDHSYGGGGEIPFPFGVVNQRLELADGELYALIGTVVFEGGTPFLEVDLDKHPWLANDRRLNDSRYPLECVGVNWRDFEGMKVRLFVEAHGKVLMEAGAAKYEISLGLVTDWNVKSRMRLPNSH
jgi:hypothetical protein